MMKQKVPITKDREYSARMHTRWDMPDVAIIGALLKSDGSWNWDIFDSDYSEIDYHGYTSSW